MTDPTPHDDDPGEAEALARVNRLRATRGKPPIVERDPAQVRHRWGVERDAMTVGLWALRRHGGHVPAAIDAAAERCPTCGIGNLPIDVARALLARAPGDRTVMRAALGDVLADWKRRPDQLTRPRIELTIWALEAAARDTIAVAEVAPDIAVGQLVERLSDELAMMAGLP